MLNKLLENTVQLCQSVGDELKKSNGDLDVTLKGQNDLVTEADIKSEQYLIEKLSELVPHVRIVCEEAGQLNDNTQSDYVWIIDPLDGTVNYSLGLPYYSISVALLKKGEPVLAVVHAPALNETFTAVKGQGAFLNSSQIVARTSEKKLIKMIAISTGIINSDFVNRKTNYHLNLVPHFNQMRLMGSQALHLCYVAAGRFHAAIKNCVHVWDDAAAALILQEAQGNYTDFKGQDIFPLSKESLLYEGKEYNSLGAASRECLDLVVSALSTSE